jgi:PAS domain S-box-containing protein
MIDAVSDSIRVLHVDDEPGFAETAGAFLEREDDRIEVETATSAEEGLDALAATDFDCIVSDYQMPGRTGIEFLTDVRERDPEIPFVLFTGKGSEEVASDAISADVTDYLQKRAGTEQYELLANRVVNAVDAYRSQQVLTERTRRLETLISNLPGMVYRCRNARSWPMELVEGEVEALTGYPAEAIERKDVDWGEDVLHPDDRERLWATVQEALSVNESFEVTYRIVTADGTTRWMWERGRGVYGDDGELDALEGFITDITDRKEREQRLERTTARLEALFENSPDMINVHDVEGNIIDPNPRLCEQTGYDRAELEEMKVWDLDQRVDPEEIRRVWEEMDIGDRHRVEGKYRRRDGSAFPVEVHIRRLGLEGRDRFVVISRDVSDREARERELQRYERVVNTMQEAACIYDEEGRFETVNEYLAEFYGSTPAELEGERSSLVPKIRARSDGDPFRELLDGERDELRGEVAGEFPGVGYEVLAYRLTPLVVDGETEGVVGVAHEMTDYRESQRDLEETNAVLTTLFETLPFGVLAEDASRNVLAVNERMFDLFEMPGTPADVVGGDCEQLVEAVSDAFENSEAFVDRINEVVATGASTRGEELDLRDGRTFARSHEPVEFVDGRGHLWTYRDVTDQKRRERELERQNDRLDEFASVVSHDLRNPLNVASGKLELAGEECDSDHLDDVARAHERMETLVDDLLTLARQGETVDSPEPVDLTALAENCWDTIATTDATLAVETDRTVRADRGRLKQLVENLYRNAVEHGGEGVTVTVGTLEDGFYVEDDGPGISPDERDDVFEAGYSTTAEGTGFGLRIVRQVAEAHGWSVRVTDGTDGGARFEVTGVEFGG